MIIQNKIKVHLRFVQKKITNHSYFHDFTRPDRINTIGRFNNELEENVPGYKFIKNFWSKIGGIQLSSVKYTVQKYKVLETKFRSCGLVQRNDL